MSDWSQIRQRLAGKWQIPLAGLSFFLLAGAFYLLRPPPKNMPISEGIDYLTKLVDGGMYDHAVELGEALAAREGEPDAQRGSVFLQLARARFGEAEQLKVPSEAVGQRIIQDYRQAARLGEVLDGNDLTRLGRALEWQGRYGEAIETYGQAVARGVAEPLELRRRMILLTRDHLEKSAAELNEQLDRFLEDVDRDRANLWLWAVEEKLYALEELGRLEEASTLLSRQPDEFQDGELSDHLAYLEAWLLHRTGYFEEAEVRLRTIRNRVDRLDSVYAMSGWLLGRVVLEHGDPQRLLEAISFFRDVIGTHPRTIWATASHVGLAEALSMLERHSEAAEEYQVALVAPPAASDRRVVNRDLIRVSLGVTADLLRQRGLAPAALPYAQTAASLADRGNVEQSTSALQQLGTLQTLAAETLIQEAEAAGAPGDWDRRLELTQRSFSLYGGASMTYAEIAQINVLNEERSSRASWRAAELAALAGDRERAARLYREFAEERPEDALVPRALFRVGQLHQSAGKPDAAISAYQECYRRFPRHLEGARSLVPMAECYLRLGGDNDELAERTLRIVLDESEVFTPAAPEFRDALYLLGDIQMRRGRFEPAIAALREVLERYPSDPRNVRARYQLAEANRRSALGLKKDAVNDRTVTDENLREEYFTRFTAALQEFRRLIDELESRPSHSLSVMEELYLRHGYMYEADGYFEIQEYEAALPLYEQAAGVLREHPSGLAAYVRIIHCHVFLGRPREARAAMSRALVWVEGIPEAAFQRSVSPEKRADWKRYFRWLESAELF